MKRTINILCDIVTTKVFEIRNIMEYQLLNVSSVKVFNRLCGNCMEAES